MTLGIAPLALVGSVALATAAAMPAHAAAPAPGVYLSDSVELVLRADGTFAVQELGGARQARGRYSTAGETLTLVSGAGDVGRTRFPVTCRVASTYGGFSVGAGQPRCRAFDGLSFKAAR